jgi:AraC family transcriptional regulator of adaptative response/methylated-DNA-[protein]-cysteine methyltransferase
MTPAKYSAGGAGMRIGYTIASCDFGRILVAATDRGVSAVRFGARDAALERMLRDEYPAAQIARDDSAMRPWLEGVLRTVSGDETQPHLPLDIRATAFRLRVWDALRRIPRGETRTYAEIAAEIGEPKAVRAVGTACGKNPVPLVVPCHRVVKSNGELGQYGMGGTKVKQRLLEGEGAR